MGRKKHKIGIAAVVPGNSWHNQFMPMPFFHWIQNQDPEKIKNSFAWIQFAIGAGLLVMVLKFAGSGSESRFRLRESDRIKKKRTRGGPPSKLKEEFAAMRLILLEGIRLDRPPHELLGVSKTASEAEIQHAYRQLMKRFHPDRVGPPGSRPWNDAQKIAEAINVAKDKLVRERRKPS